MPSFKPKTNKEITVDVTKNITLDTKHNEYSLKFKDYETIQIPRLQEKINKLQQPIDEKQRLLVLKYQKQIDKMKMEIKNYYLENSKYIFSYFEEKKNISEGGNKTKLLNNFFKRPSEQKKPQHE